MPTFKARLHGVEPAPVTVSAGFVDGRLRIDSHDLDLDPAGLVVSVGGADGDELYLNWRGPSGEARALRPLGEHDLAQLLAGAPPALAAGLGKWHTRRHHARKIALAFAGLAVTGVLVLMLLWWQYERAIGWIADRIPVSVEERLGDAVLAQVKAGGGVSETGPAVDVVRTVGERLTRGSQYKYQWLVKKDATVNAFAAPGGVVVVHTALIERAASADELAGVLAHEVQHVERRHSLKNMLNSVGLAAAAGMVFGDISGVAVMMAHQLGSLSFSRDLEAEADRLGYGALVKAGIDPDGMVSFFHKLEKEQGDATPPLWLSSHPATGDRIRALQALAREQPCAACRPLALDWRPVQAAARQGGT